MAIIDDIYQQFIDYFGEDKVDLQRYNEDSSDSIQIERYLRRNCEAGCYAIIVHWPTVTISNEYDDSIDIWDLYSASIVSEEGKLKVKPLFIRSTYDKIQWSSDYLHSHVRSIDKGALSAFKQSCLGSGPLTHTIPRLTGESITNSSDYTDMNIWKLYCWELDKCVRVESLTGVPYKKLTELGNYSTESSGLTDFKVQSYYNISYRVKDLFKQFLTTLIEQNVLKFSFINGSYIIASSYIETVLSISNFFINFYNSSPYNHIGSDQYIRIRDLIDNGLLVTMFIKGNILYDKNSSDYPIEAAINTRLFTFKGEDVKLKLKDFEQNYDSNELCLLNPQLIDYIVYLLLKYVNVKYGQDADTSNQKDRLL